MSRVVPISEEAFKEARRLAAELGISPSEIVDRAVREFVARHSPARVTAAINRVVDEAGSAMDEWSRLASQKVFERVDW